MKKSGRQLSVERLKAHLFSSFARVAIFSLLIIFVAAFSYSTAFADTAETASLIVKMVGGLTADQQAAVVARDGGTEISSIPALRLHVVEFPAADLDAIFSNYQSDPQVQSVEINQTRKVEALPLDPLYGSQWALPKIGWDSLFGVVNPFGQATVAVLDTGVDASHPDLLGNIVSGTSVIDGSGGTVDLNGHGTALAGIVAAVSNNIGIVGIGFSGVKIMPVKVLSDGGTGQESDIISGVIYAADNGADIILMGFSNPGFSQNLQDAIDYAWSKNVVLVAATGNDAVSDPTYPAGDRGVMGVSATDSSDALALFSNYGADTFLAAPGVDIVTTGSDYVTYPSISGTSASAAIVAGVAAFMKANDPTLENGVIVGRMAESADPAGTAGQTGNGRVNMYRAVTDTSDTFVQPAGAPGGGPIVGPYKIAARTVSVAIGPQGGAIPTYGTAGSATYSVTLTTTSGNGNTTANLTVTGLPAGATSSPASVTFNTSPYIFTLTVTTSSTTPAVSGQSFTVSTDRGGSANSSITINKATPTVTVSGGPFTYDGSSHAATVSVTGVGGATVSGSSTVTYTGTGGTVYGPSTTAPTNAGSYSVSASFTSSDSNYNNASGSGSIIINKAPVTATAGSGSGTYNGSTQSPSACVVTGTYTGDLACTNNPTSVGPAANTYTISPNVTGTGLTNFDITSVNGSYVINKAPVTATAGSGSGTYNGSTQSPAACQVTGTYTGDLSCTNNPTSVGPAANTYTISPNVTGTGLTNFDITSVNGSYTINKAPLTITINDATVQYSDPEPTYTVESYNGFVNGEDSSVLGGSLSCTTSATISSGMVMSGPGDYTISCGGFTSDNYDITYAITYDGTNAKLTVTQEDAEITYISTNPTAVQVASPGGASGTFSISVDVQELLPDAGCPGDPADCPGDISNATVAIQLQPIGPGGNVNPSSACNITPGGTTGYGAFLSVSCDFNNVPVNTYSVEVTVSGYYTGSYEGVLTVYDPSLGFTTGGGWFYWPPTQEQLDNDPEYPGDKTNFGYTMKYNKKQTNIQGSLLVIRHLADGTIYRLKSNSLGGLSLGTNYPSMPFGWASFTGSATYQEPNWTDAVGNYSFTAYVEDNNEPGTGNDNFWIEVKNKAKTVVSPLSLSKDKYGHAIAVPILGGNIVVPHTRGK